MTSRDLPVPLAFAGGEVHNRVDPFASALIVDGDRIAWLGSDEAVEVVGGAPPTDLAGQLVTSPFVDAWVEDLDDDLGLRMMERGVRAAMAVHASQEEAGGVLRTGGSPVHIVHAARDSASRVADAWEPQVDAIPVLAGDDAPEAVLSAAGEHRARLVFEADTAARLAALLRAAEKRRAKGVRLPGSRHLVRVSAAGEDSPRRLADLGFSLIAVHGSAPDLVRLGVAAGAAIALGWPSDEDPWEVLRRAVITGGASSRSAFGAATRGGWRVLEPTSARGEIAPGTPADLAFWSTGELVVRAADSRLAAWSTDPRAGTPGLPDLVPGAPTPRLRSLLFDGANPLAVI